MAALAGALDRQRHGRAICCLCGASLPDISVTKGAYVFHEPETDRFSAALVASIVRAMRRRRRQNRSIPVAAPSDVRDEPST